MNTQERTLPTAIIAVSVAIAMMVAAVSLSVFGGPAQATHVTPELLPGASNDGKACADLQGSETWEVLKLEGSDLINGIHTDGTLEVTISNLTDRTFDWSSNIGVDGVVVKDGVDGANFYLYDPEDTADTGLSTPGGQRAISHISFCYDEEEPTPTPTPTPTSTSTSTPTPTSTSTSTPTPTSTSTSTPTPTSTSTSTPTPTSTSTSTPTPTSTSTSTPTPTSTSTSTPTPTSTSTSTPTPTSTSTSTPTPTSTSTSTPTPTSTSTSTPTPTSTSTSTPTPTSTSTSTPTPTSTSTSTPTPTSTSTATPTPAATATATATPTGTDSDGDSLGFGNPLWFRDEIELAIGTDPLNPCPDDTIPDNEADDKWAPDLNDDQAANILDRARMVSQLLSGVYDQRFDLNDDGVLNIQDRLIELLYVLEFQKTGVCPSL